MDLYNKPSPTEYLNDELYHWGVKRKSGRYPYGSGENPYQGESSSLRSKLLGLGKKKDKVAQGDTESQKKVKNKSNVDIKSNSDVQNQSANQQKSKKITRVKPTKHNFKRMSDEELNRAVERLRQEQNYKNLYNDLYANKGKQYLKSEMGKGATSVIRYAISKTGNKLVDKALDKAFAEKKTTDASSNSQNSEATKSAAKAAASNSNKGNSIKDFFNAFGSKKGAALAIKDTVSKSVAPTANDVKEAFAEEMSKYRNSLVDTKSNDSIFYLPGPTATDSRAVGSAATNKYRNLLVDTKSNNPVIYLPGPTADDKKSA